MKKADAYVTVFDRGFGKECLYIPLDYDFWSSGILLNPTVGAFTHGRLDQRMHLELTLVNGQAEAARIYGTSQQNISRWIKRHLEVQRQVVEKGSITRVRLESHNGQFTK